MWGEKGGREKRVGGREGRERLYHCNSAVSDQGKDQPIRREEQGSLT